MKARSKETENIKDPEYYIVRPYRIQSERNADTNGYTSA